MRAMSLRCLRLTMAASTWALLMVASAAAQEVPRMTPQELASRLGNPDLVVLDVRAEADWRASDSKVQGALREDPRRVGNWAARYSKLKTIVLYCA